MKKKNILKTMAFVSAVALTAGVPLSVQKSTFSAMPLTAYADEAYTQGKEGQLSYLKYSDHIEIYGCDSSATSVEIPSTISGLPVTVIGMYAFQCTKLKSIKIPDSVKEIGHWAFSMCSDLTSVTIPDSVEKIGIRAFEMCSSLSTVNFPDRTIDFNSNIFESTPWLTEQRKKDPFVVVNGALLDAQTCEGKVVIPSDITSVASSAFARNTKVTSIVFPSSIKKISDNVCFYCENLTSVEIKGAELIDSMAFCGCTKLTDLKISGKLKTIDDYAFSDATSNATITFYGSKDKWDKVEKPTNDKFLQNARMVYDTSYVEPEDIAGDVNGDGTFNVSDLVLFQKWLLAAPNASLKNWKAANFVNDNVLDVYDLCLMRKALINK